MLRLRSDPFSLVLRLTLFTVTGDIVLTNGFMLLRIPPIGPGVPINEVILAADLLVILLGRAWMRGFSDTPVFVPLVLLWIQAIIQLLNGLYVGGVWAIRDSANIIETGFLFVGYWLASDPRFEAICIRWFRRMLNFAALYILLYPIQTLLTPFSPMIPSMSGYAAPLFFSYGNPASVAVAAACQMIVSNFGRPFYRILLTGTLVMNLIVFVQARIAYLQLALLMAIVTLFRPKRLASLGTMVFITVVFIALFLASGIKFPGRLGTTFSLDFLSNHLQAIWGGGDSSISAAAEGVDLRLGWWQQIDKDLHRDLHTWLFGLGYGIPLTSFRGPTDDIVREPHNSYMSIYGRLGVVGSINFFLVQAVTIITAVRLIFAAKRSGSEDLSSTAITMLCFLGVHLIYSSAEGGLEVSFIAVPYYFLAGTIIAFQQRLAARQKALAFQAGGEGWRHMQVLPPPAASPVAGSAKVDMAPDGGASW